MTLSFILSKKFVLKLLLILWLIFSAGYIAWNIWGNIRDKLLTQAYLQGVNDTVNNLITEAEKTECQPISIFNKEAKKEIQVINIKCITNQE